jgi:ABC-type multidrug transport system fused ATPase/permease subunit
MIVALFINFSVGFLDGLGLTMFLPLLQMADQSSNVSTDDLGGLRFIVDLFIDNGIPLSLLLVLCVMVFFFLLKGIAQYLNGWYRVNVQQYFIKNLRLSSINGVSEIEFRQFLLEDGGRIQNTLSGEVDRVARAYQGYFQSVQSFMMVLVYMGFAFSVNAQFALLVTVAGLFTNIIYKQIYNRTKGASRKLTNEQNVFQGQIIQFIGNFKYLRATGLIAAYANRLKETVNEIEANNKKIGLLTALITAAREPLIIMVVAAIIYVQTQYFGSPLAPIFVSLLFFYRALTYLMMMQNQWNLFVSVSGSLENMTEFTNSLKRYRKQDGHVFVDRIEPHIELKSVSLKLGEKQILSDVNLTIEHNQVIGLVGESGSGKSSLVNVICGLLLPDSGSIIIDGTPIQNIQTASYQKRIGYITQEPVIFNDTLYNNITFWQPATPENKKRFEDILRKASLYEFVQSLPKREHSMLGNAGLNISGGQRQRISIARELYKDIDLLVMDEATSALDSETEFMVQESIETLKGSITMVIVAHRLSTIRNADRVILMDKGKVEAMGTFDQLMKKSGRFKRMVEFQEF